MDPRENERLSLTGPGTPCGEMMRRYWIPIEISEQLKDLPKLVRFLGEDLVLFRDGRGRPGLLGKHCSHRGTSLEYGQIEEDGIRCCYHAWLYDVAGRVLDTPAEPPESNFRHSVRHLAYPCRELGGWIFTYMGPPEKMPELPRYDFLVREDGTRDLWTIVYDFNWLQHAENFGDPVHTALLHQIPSKWRFGDYRLTIPDFDVEPTEDGITTIYIRPTWRRRVRFILPCLAILPEVNHAMFGPDGEVLPDAQSRQPQDAQYTLAFWTVPIDDTHHLAARMQFVPYVDGKPRTDYNTPAREKAKTYEESQRAPEDREAQEGQGPVAHREQWHLASSDKAVIAFQEIIANAIRAVEKGEDPPGIIRDPAQAKLVNARASIATTFETSPIEPWRLNRKVWGQRLGAVIE